MFIVLAIIISIGQAQHVNFYMKLHHTWSGTVFFPDGTKRLIGTFSELGAGSGYLLELEHQDARIVLKLRDMTVTNGIDLDLTGMKVVSRGKDHFVGIPQAGWQVLVDQFAPGDVIISFPTMIDKLYSCTKDDPANCTTADWKECTTCSRTGQEWTVPPQGSYGTSNDSQAPVDVVKKADELLKWKEILMALVALAGMGWGALKLAKRHTLGEERVELLRDIALESGQVKLTLTVLNHSTFAIRKVEVHLEVPEHLKVKEPAVLPLEMGDVEAEERMTAVFRLIPIQRVTGNIHGTVTYLDRRGERVTVPLKEVPVPCLCSFMVKTAISEEEFDEKLGHMETVTRRRKSTQEQNPVIDGLKERCSVLEPIAERWESDEEWVGKYFAKERHSNREFGLVIRYRKAGKEGEKAPIEIIAFGEDRGTITGLAEEIAVFLDYEEENKGDELLPPA
jgi:hypothetical protein